jgi:hypothetical protein
MLSVERNDEAFAITGILSPHTPAETILAEAENGEFLRGSQPRLSLSDQFLLSSGSIQNVRDYCLFEGRRVSGKHWVSVHKCPNLFSGAKICNFRSQIALIVEHLTLAETNHTVREHVKTLRRIVFVQQRRRRLLPRMDPENRPGRYNCTVVADLKRADGNTHHCQSIGG